MLVESTVMSVSWIPTESVSGPLRLGFGAGLAHYDAPPPDHLRGADELRALCREDRFRFANLLQCRVEVEDGKITSATRTSGSGLVMGSTRVTVAAVGATFRAFSLPVIPGPTQQQADSVRFVQTVGGRTGVPLPRPVPHRPFVQWQAPTVWTTLALTVHADGRSEVELVGASSFPRHWVYGADGALALKSGLTDQSSWVAGSFGRRTPWGDQDSPALVSVVESELERELSADIMRSGRRPEIRRVTSGATVARQGDPGSELFLLLDGVLSVEVDGVPVAEVGPGAVLGERALLEGGRRTATLVARTPARLAVAPAGSVDLDRLRSLATLHQREAGAADEGGSAT